jgi:hypothetical protein
MLLGITDAFVHRFFDFHLFNITGVHYFTGLLGILLVEISAFFNFKNTSRWNHDR